MMYMLVFWILLAVSLIILLLKRYYPKVESISLYILLLAFAFLVVAIVTKDPLFSRFGVPAEYEWIVGLFATSLSSWKLYFSPLKERVIRTEKEVSAVQADVSAIKYDTSLIKEKLMGK